MNAANGSQALEKALLHPPHLVVAEVGQPEQHGYELQQSFHGHKALINIPFIFLSARSEKADNRQGLPAATADHLTGLFDAHDLYRAIETRLKKAKVQQLILSLAKQTSSESQEVFRYLMEAFEKQQHHLSMTLRDHINQTLTSCKLMMEVAGEGGAYAQQLVKKSCESLNHVIGDLQKICYELDQSALQPRTYPGGKD